MAAGRVKSPEARRYRQGTAVLTTFRGWCKGCDLCIGSCPVGILALGGDERIEVTDISRCIFCGICATRCPDFVFVLDRRGGEPDRRRGERDGGRGERAWSS